MFGALDLRHQHRHALRRCGREQRERFAGAGEFTGVDGGARQRQRAFQMPRRFRRQRLDPHQPLPRRITELHMRVDIGQIGMRIDQPRRLDDAHVASGRKVGTSFDECTARSM